MQYDVLDRIREQYEGMSKGHKKIASFILEHYDQAVFMTVFFHRQVPAILLLAANVPYIFHNYRRL